MSRTGFTLVEMLVALTIFGLLSAAGVAVLSMSVRTQALADHAAAELSTLRRAGATIGADLAEAVPRTARDSSGTARPALAGGGPDRLLTLVRGGWERLDDTQRSTLQKVEYRLSEGRLERIGYRHVDGGAPLLPVVLAEEVSGVGLRFRDPAGVWREHWDPEDPTLLPVAVELVIQAADRPVLRQLFLVGPRA